MKEDSFIYVFDGGKSKAVRTNYETCNKWSCIMTHLRNMGRISYATMQEATNKESARRF